MATHLCDYILKPPPLVLFFSKHTITQQEYIKIRAVYSKSLHASKDGHKEKAKIEDQNSKALENHTSPEHEEA